MAIYTGAYEGARSCTSGPQPGAWGAMDYFLAAYRSRGGVNTGIYNCRTVRGGRTTSLHGEGRAADFGIRPYGAAYGTALANALVAYSKELGIQCVIWNRRIWSSSYPHSGWRKYNGVASHTDHIHVEFTWARARAGRAATAKHFAKVLGGVKPDDVKLGGSGSTYKTVTGKTPTVRLYHKGEPVKRIQKAVGVKADGYYGPATVTAVKKFQRQRGLAADGIVGAKTWAAINSSSGGGGKSSGGSKVKAASGEAFPWPAGHWAGEESKNSKNHSGYHSKDRAGIKVIQTAVGVKADGVFGPATTAAVKALQKRAGVAADGLVGEATWKHLDTRKKAPSASGLTVDGKWGKATTRALQKALGVKADGIRGRATVRAIQKRVGARQDGIMGKATIRGIQRRVGVRQDGNIGPATVKALQRALNAGTF